MSPGFDCCRVNDSNSVIVWQIKCRDKQYAELGDEKWKSSRTGAETFAWLQAHKGSAKKITVSPLSSPVFHVSPSFGFRYLYKSQESIFM